MRGAPSISKLLGGGLPQSPRPCSYAYEVRSKLIKVYPFYHSICIFWTHCTLGWSHQAKLLLCVQQMFWLPSSKFFKILKTDHRDRTSLVFFILSGRLCKSRELNQWHTVRKGTHAKKPQRDLMPKFDTEIRIYTNALYISVAEQITHSLACAFAGRLCDKYHYQRMLKCTTPTPLVLNVFLMLLHHNLTGNPYG